MTALDALKAHYSKIAGDKIKVVVSNGSGGDLEMYFTPMTVNDQAYITRNSKDAQEIVVETLIRKAVDKDGNPLFKKEDKLDLMRSVDGNLVAEIVKQYTGEAKNLRGIVKVYEGN